MKVILIIMIIYLLHTTMIILLHPILRNLSFFFILFHLLYLSDVRMIRIKRPKKETPNKTVVKERLRMGVTR
jgi:hypothetical protein